MKIALALFLVVATVSCHHQPVTVPVRERTYYGIPAEAEDSDGFCVPSEQAGPPIVCVSIGQVRAYVRQQRYAP